MQVLHILSSLALYDPVCFVNKIANQSESTELFPVCIPALSF